MTDKTHTHNMIVRGFFEMLTTELEEFKMDILKGSPHDAMVTINIASSRYMKALVEAYEELLVVRKEEL